MKAFVFAAGTLLTLLACKKLTGGGNAEKQAPSAEPASGETSEKPGALALDETFSVGQTAQADGMKITVAETRDCVHEQRHYQDSLDKRGLRLVGALVYFEGDFAERAATVRSHAFKAFDGEGITYSGRSPSSTDCTPTLKSDHVDKGDKKKGWVAFEVPKATDKLELRYEHKTPARQGQQSRDQIVKFRLLGAGSTG